MLLADIPLSSEELIHYGGFGLILLVIFAETGLLVGFFLPGDYFLFLSGVFCGTGFLDFPLFVLTVGIIGAAIIGNFTGYYIGHLLGPKLFDKEDSWIFKKSYLIKTSHFYEKYGARALVIGRFLPLIRTFVPVLAGAINMNLPRFSLYNVVGAILWVGILVPMGYYFGVKFPQIMNYVHWIIIGFTIITIWPLVSTYIKMNKK